MTRELGRQKRLPLAPGRQQERAHARRLPYAQGGNVGLDELHGVVDRESRRHHAARRIDVERDVLVGILGLQKQQLRDDQVGGYLVHRTDQENHALLEQARVDVVRALAAPALLDHHRYQAQPLRFDVARHHLFPISSSKSIGLSCAFAAPSAHSTTFSSTATDSISRSRSGDAVEPLHDLLRPLVALRLLLDQRPHLLRPGLQVVRLHELAQDQAEVDAALRLPARRPPPAAAYLPSSCMPRARGPGAPRPACARSRICTSPLGASIVVASSSACITWSFARALQARP